MFFDEKRCLECHSCLSCDFKRIRTSGGDEESPVAGLWIGEVNAVYIRGIFVRDPTIGMSLKQAEKKDTRN